MRLSRKMGLYASNDAKYVWAMYNLGVGGYHADESITTDTGSFSVSYSSNSVMKASAYTATATSFTLTDPVQISRNNLQVGDYIVDASTGNSTATTGSYLYKITSIVPINQVYTNYFWTRWSPTPLNGRGDTIISYAKSDTMDYPSDGLYGGYWYVLVKGETTMYVWNVYDYESGYHADETTAPYTSTFSNRYASSTTIMAASAYTATSTGFTLVNPVQTNLYNIAVGSYIVIILTMAGSNSAVSGSYLYKITSKSGTTFGYTRWTPTLYTIKGDLVTTAESEDDTAYPQDGAQGEYWYTYSHSYVQNFDNR